MKLKLPDKGVNISVTNYGEYHCDNYGTHTQKFWVDGFGEFYFSYETMVAFQIFGGDLYVHRNDWDTTTGKHLNWIDGGHKEARLTREEFEEKLDAELARIAGNPNQGN